jgi:hypothetical protein
MRGWHNQVAVADGVRFVGGEAPALDIDVEAISGRRQFDVVRIQDTQFREKHAGRNSVYER